MAIVTSGPFVGFNGTVDGITYYQLPDGRTVAKKKNTKSNIPPTIKQISVKGDTRIFSKFMKPLQGFVLSGYALEAKIMGMNPNNAMVKTCRKDALQGVYPNRSIDFSKVLISKGSLPMPEHAAAAITNIGVEFSWSTELIQKLTFHSDQVMMLAHFPDLNEVRYVPAGASRDIGKDVLNLNGIKKGHQAAVYIAFIADDRRTISNSIYLGQFNW